jgi:serine/threonine-protein kinase
LWTADNRIIMPTQAVTRRRSGLSEVGATGGTAKEIMFADTIRGENFMYPASLDDGKTILFESFGPASNEDDKLAIGSLTTGQFTVLDFLAVKPLGYLEGFIICIRWDDARGTILALPVDIRARKITGDPIELQGNIAHPYGAALSKNGTLAFVTGGTTAQLVSQDRSGKIEILISEPRYYQVPRFSPDGTRIAFQAAASFTSDLSIYDIPGRTLSRLTTGSGATPAWYADGKRILFHRPTTATAGLLWQFADGSALPEQLHPRLPPGVGTPFDPVLSPDQTTIVFVALAGSHRGNIYYFKPGVDDVARPWVATASDDFSPRFSPDGKWIAYVSDESGSDEVFVRPFPGPGPRVQISSGGGNQPVWSRDGRRIYYKSGQTIIEASVTSGVAFSLGARRPAFTMNNLPSENSWGSASYDVSPDGQRIIFAKGMGDEQTLVVTHNWFADVRRKLELARR